MLNTEYIAKLREELEGYIEATKRGNGSTRFHAHFLEQQVISGSDLLEVLDGLELTDEQIEESEPYQELLGRYNSLVREVEEVKTQRTIQIGKIIGTIEKIVSGKKGPIIEKIEDIVAQARNILD